MGLAERRRIAAIGEDVKQAQVQLNEVVGYPLPLHCDLGCFPEVPAVLDCYDAYKDYCFPMIIRIFQDVCRDDLGRQAVKDKISSVVVSNTSTGAEDPGTMAVWGEDPLRKAIENLL
jgi:hypothetical protein